MTVFTLHHFRATDFVITAPNDYDPEIVTGRLNNISKSGALVSQAFNNADGSGESVRIGGVVFYSNYIVVPSGPTITTLVAQLQSGRVLRLIASADEASTYTLTNTTVGGTAITLVQTIVSDTQSGWVVTVPDGTNGVFNFNLTATDSSGNVSTVYTQSDAPSVVTVTDTDAPIVTIEASITDRTFTVVATSNEDIANWDIVIFDGSTVGVDPIPVLTARTATWAYTTFNNSAHDIRTIVAGFDAANNKSTDATVTLSFPVGVPTIGTIYATAYTRTSNQPRGSGARGNNAIIGHYDPVNGSGDNLWYTTAAETGTGASTFDFTALGTTISIGGWRQTMSGNNAGRQFFQGTGAAPFLAGSVITRAYIAKVTDVSNEENTYSFPIRAIGTDVASSLPRDGVPSWIPTGALDGSHVGVIVRVDIIEHDGTF